ncbi:MAG: superoxide dismutase [Cyanobacteria bacterium NC_groundwater_1444_Ag_S-0.65um_54_12]|nr:superoxide dismutase [Cyanobacteria bacterium NC_groundwater_1444_Ag_S-0.65um_54_12]
MVYELPSLPYDYSALDPYIDEQTVRIHHDKHHAAYVAGLNAALEKLERARSDNDTALVQHYERLVAFNGAGHVNHALYWQNMGPDAGREPTGDLAARIQRDFGSFEACKIEFTQATVSVEGSGWGLLAWEPMQGRLITLALMNHQNSFMTGATPLLICDAWEHAYYLKYQNRRADYVAAWWGLVNWHDVARRFMATARATAMV